MTEIKKEKKKLKKLAQKLDSDDDGSDHELSYYMDDRVKLMKEVLKIIKPKKIKAMAPHCLKVCIFFSVVHITVIIYCSI